MTSRPTYTIGERDKVYATLVYVAKLLTQNGANVVIDATGNLRHYREKARHQIPRFMEAYMECSLDICMNREAKRANTHLAPRQIYAKVTEGRATTVPGFGQPYEPPLHPEMSIDTAKHTVLECAQRILETLFQRFYHRS
jgi:adenylylsulfate kinase